MSSPRPPTVTELFCLDHRRLDALLLEVKRCAAEGDLARAVTRLADFRRGIERHMATEEEVLLPAFERATGIREGGPAQVMRVEHAEITQRIAGIAEALERESAEDHLALFAVLTGLLSSHNAREEHDLYPAADRAAQGDATLIPELQRRIEPL